MKNMEYKDKVVIVTGGAQGMKSFRSRKHRV